MHKRALYGSNWLGHFGWVWPFPRILGRCIHAGQAMIAIVGSCKNGESRYPGRYLAPNSLPTDCRIPAGHRLDADRAGGPIQSPCIKRDRPRRRQIDSRGCKEPRCPPLPEWSPHQSAPSAHDYHAATGWWTPMLLSRSSESLRMAWTPKSCLRWAVRYSKLFRKVATEM